MTVTPGGLNQINWMEIRENAGYKGLLCVGSPFQWALVLPSRAPAHAMNLNYLLFL